ncbi:MAG: ABC transporter ATP-binding protein [Smithella sp.]|nr:ABC transporter ATP-binding protein [Smithella sp.]HQG64835.1 ABC transporter ATP-binding protein [Smithella sp.]HQH16059.1 ABC transporter ATP-binding protein [Smithella sp.]
MSLITARNVKFSYETHPVMDDVSLTIDESQMAAIIGPNGSGKTTLLKMINGTLLPDSGQMLIEGKETGKWSRREIARKVAIVPQETADIFPFYAEEIVLMGRFPHLGRYRFEDEKDYQIVHNAMEKTDTLAFASRRFNELSAGERQRVLIARALAQEPKILLLDESTVFLDLKHQAEFLALLHQLNIRQKLTVIFVTHDINLAAQNARMIILLASGKIYAIGTPAEIITAANIKAVYDVEAGIDSNPYDGSPRVTLLNYRDCQ